jgi:hypothetical protein
MPETCKHTCAECRCCVNIGSGSAICWQANQRLAVNGCTVHGGLSTGMTLTFRTKYEVYCPMINPKEDACAYFEDIRTGEQIAREYWERRAGEEE